MISQLTMRNTISISEIEDSHKYLIKNMILYKCLDLFWWIIGYKMCTNPS